MKFSNEQCALLERPIFAQLATVMPDGSPHLCYIWHRRVGDSIHMICDRNSVKARNITADPRISMTVGDNDYPYRYIEIRGTAELVHDESIVHEEVKRMANRYLGGLASHFVEKTVGHIDWSAIIISPTKVTLRTTV